MRVNPDRNWVICLIFPWITHTPGGSCVTGAPQIPPSNTARWGGSSTRQCSPVLPSWWVWCWRRGKQPASLILVVSEPEDRCLAPRMGLKRGGSDGLLRNINSPKEQWCSSTAAQGVVGSPSLRCPRAVGMWHWGTWAVRMVGWLGLGLGITEVFSTLNDYTVVWKQKGVQFSSWACMPGLAWL